MKHLKEATIISGSGMEYKLSEWGQRQCVSEARGALGSNTNEFVFHSINSFLLAL